MQLQVIKRKYHKNKIEEVSLEIKTDFMHLIEWMIKGNSYVVCATVQLNSQQ